MSNDEDLYFTFDLGDNDNINAEFELEENDSIDCLFEINAAGTVWGSISGTLSDQEDLQAALDLKADKSELESDMAAVDEAISNVQTVIENNYNTLDSKIDNVQSDLSGDISTLENTLNNRIDATNQTVAELSTTVADNNTAINNRVDGIVDSFDGDISNLETAIQNEAATRANNDTLLQGDINTLRNDLTSEISNRTSADDTLQDNIDNIQNTIDNYGDIISYNASDFATAAQGLLAESALQPNDNISELNNDAGYLTNADLSGYLRNTATGSNSLTIDGIASNKTNSINIGAQSTVNNYSIALGYYATASGSSSMALGLTANAFAQNAIQIGSGANSTANTLQVRSYTLLDTSTGLIPDARISSNIARSSDIPTFTDEQIAALNSGANTANIGQIATNTGNISSLSNTVTSNYNTLDGRITSEVNTLNGAITGEATNRQNADNALQTQIDAITSASDVFDIVGTYAELQAYDISTVPVNDIIKVLVDSTHNNAATYYRCVENNNVKSWSYIGAEGAYYTKSEADNKFVEQTITVNGQPLSSNVTLTASDVGALPSSTTIGAGVLTIQKNGVDVDTFNANATTNKTINMTVPTDTNDLTNGAGFITSSAIGNGTVTINQGGSQKGTFTLNQSGNVTIDLDAGGGTPTNMVTTDTAQDISGRKTFLGEKAIYFKQTATSNKLGFTLYNPSNGELAALEYRPNTISGASLLALNCPQTTGGYVGFRYWGTPAVNIVAPKVATAGNYFMATHITDGSTTVTASNTGTINISTLLPDISTKQDTLVSGTNIKTINNQSILGSGNIDTSEIFIAQYGITSYTDITTAINNGKLVLCTYNGSTYYYDGSGGGFISFTTNTVGTNYVITVDSSNNWTNDSRAFPNKTSDLTNDSGYITNSALSGYATESYVNTGLAAKQNTLVSGTNIKTVNNTSILGSGNIDTSEIFIAKYNVTTFQQVLNAYSTGKTIVCDLSPFRCLTITYDPTLRQFVFSGVSINNLSDTGILLYYIILNSSDNWSIVQKQLADTDLSNLSTTGQAVIDGKVSKSGDTMTGNLILENACVMQREGAIKGTSPSENIYWGLNFCDSQGVNIDNRIGTIESSYTSSGTTRTDILVYEPTSGSANNARIRLGYTTNKVAYCEFPDTTCVDGQWVSKWVSVFSGVTAVGNGDYSISSYLPNDGHAYEVLACMQMNDDGTTSGTDSAAAVGNVAKPVDNNCFRIYGNSDKGIWKPRFNGVLVFLGNQRKVYYQITGRALQQGLGLWFFGYRRIGTNS